MHSSKRNWVTSKWRFQDVRGYCDFLPHYRYNKKGLFEAFSPKFSCEKIVLMCNNSDQTWFSDTLTSAGPLRRCWNPSLKITFDPYIVPQRGSELSQLPVVSQVDIELNVAVVTESRDNMVVIDAAECCCGDWAICGESVRATVWWC